MVLGRCPGIPAARFPQPPSLDIHEPGDVPSPGKRNIGTPEGNRWPQYAAARRGKPRVSMGVRRGSPEIQIYLRGWCGVLALGGWAPLDRHLGLNQPWCLQEASPAPGHLLGLEGAGRGLTEAMGEGSRREDAGVLARKPALPVWELPRAGADISAPTRLQGFRRGSVRTNCTNPQYLQSIVMWLAPSHMLCIKYLFILVIIP